MMNEKVCWWFDCVLLMWNVWIGDFESVGVEVYGLIGSRVYKFIKVKVGCVMLIL